MIKELAVGDTFKWINEYVPDERVGTYFSAADVVALPYHTATQSGVVPLAYHFNKPVVVTRVGGLHEVVEDGKSGYLVTKNSPEELAECLRENLTNGHFLDMNSFIEEYKKKFSWERFVEDLEELLEQ